MLTLPFKRIHSTDFEHLCLIGFPPLPQIVNYEYIMCYTEKNRDLENRDREESILAYF